MTLGADIAKNGRFPPIELAITPLEGAPFIIKTFLNYSFSSSIMVPVDSFSFEFSAPDDKRPLNEILKSGDIVQVRANRKAIATGFIDMVDMTINEEGETIMISGRDLIAQLEDNDAIDAKNAPIFANKYTVNQVFALLIKNTRIRSTLVLQDAPTKAYLFATEPQETKLTALLRYLSPLNVLPWSLPDGSVKIGRPNMAQAPKGRLYINKAQRKSNVLSIRSTRNTTRVPNVIVPIWTGQELVNNRVGQQQALNNARPEPARLRRLGHRVIKTVVVSTPQGDSAQELSDINNLEVGGQNLLQAHAKRELARENVNEHIVQVEAAGHYNSLGEPYVTDTTYRIQCDRAGIDEVMYLFSVDYGLSEEGSQRSILKFCPLGTIVSDIKAV